MLENAGGDRITGGDIIGSTGVAIGRDIQVVVNQGNLPDETLETLNTILRDLKQQTRQRLLDYIGPKRRICVLRVFAERCSRRAQHRDDCHRPLQPDAVPRFATLARSGQMDTLSFAILSLQDKLFVENAVYPAAWSPATTFPYTL
jgi:hypothetical protein